MPGAHSPFPLHLLGQSFTSHAIPFHPSSHWQRFGEPTQVPRPPQLFGQPTNSMEQSTPPKPEVRNSIHHRHHCRSHLVHCSCTHTSFACSLCHGNLVSICICCCCKRQLPHLPIPVCSDQCTFQFHNFCLSIRCSTRMYHCLCTLHVHHNLSSTVFEYKSLPQSLVCSSIHRRGNLNVGYLRIPYYRFVNCMRHLCSLWRRSILASTWPFWNHFLQ